ncbi:radical SAM family heme chaperone HemW [Clostridium botulinum]|uniref:radical SAM family heme chaperone HemW n=1 Tax=Clostridium botulinum TaxID=1491 RepID=UPI000774AF20|nr:radical SAM family heme chaperone HemW [Clostridium botulinum]MBY6809672.1 oxygen-independent coproporphyrinogen III oxidase [Clostridium botulinum]MBY6823295.1 oxygen-independent coproporphyrinogen III oxidase [Clostridium botulinum]MBY6833725.1 oxygen-independent coproporphyrinogen III oxidase [Clostridium botulinum]MBY6971787.1 oxygen-independent coproporphyrinogen III oxidase [Clostridium botulinum]NFL86907.1 oxygen-independent coproporphyrinogen III oxidase [Clostridium botulinum]
MKELFLKEISLYIHIPFCKQKCLYCDFPSYSGKEKFISGYIGALNKEIKDKASSYKIKSIFIGGGTPSYLDEIELEKLLKCINTLTLGENLEFTIECNPGSLSEDKLKIMKKYNVNRISMGLQSTKPSLLKEIGRIHTFEEFENNYLLARKVGFKNINIDLMFGLPNQSVEDWRKTLEKIIEFNPEHISAYSLIIEEGTCFYNLYNQDKLNLPSEEKERDMYLLTKKILKENGYSQYEISNFSKDKKECYHNIVYWQLNEYLGLGVSSSSYIEGKRIKNIDDIELYIKNINSNESVENEIYENNINDDMEEFMFMGLRMIRGIEERDFKERFKKDIDEVYGDVIYKNIKQELLIRNGGRIYLTSRGIEVSNSVMSDFII